MILAGTVVAYPANFNFQSRAQQFGESEGESPRYDSIIQSGVEQYGNINVNAQGDFQQYSQRGRWCNPFDPTDCY